MLHIEYLDFVVDIDMEDGMNVCYLSWRNKVVIHGDAKRKKQGLTYGMPLLFPTPNRTENNRYRYKGRHYKAKMHGLFRRLPFELLDKKSVADEYQITGILKWGPIYEDFENYPFECQLKIHISIRDHSILYAYELINCGDKNLPFGFGVHPFFENANQDAQIMSPATRLLTSQHSMSTGKVQEVQGTAYDLSAFHLVKRLNLDHVYMPNTRENGLSEVAVIQWSDYQLSILCSKEFTHLVIYTPRDEDKFCVEPQTCAIDAFNLYDSGYIAASGVEEVRPNETKSGMIQFTLFE